MDYLFVALMGLLGGFCITVALDRSRAPLRSRGVQIENPHV